MTPRRRNMPSDLLSLPDDALCTSRHLTRREAAKGARSACRSLRDACRALDETRASGLHHRHRLFVANSRTQVVEMSPAHPPTSTSCGAGRKARGSPETGAASTSRAAWWSWTRTTALRALVSIVMDVTECPVADDFFFCSLLEGNGRLFHRERRRLASGVALRRRQMEFTVALRRVHGRRVTAFRYRARAREFCGHIETTRVFSSARPG